MRGGPKTPAVLVVLPHQEDIVKQKLSILRNLPLGAAVAFALAFGATQAWAKGDPCTLPPEEVQCIDESLPPDEWCEFMCEEWHYPPDGRCLMQYDCCICPEK